MIPCKHVETLKWSLECNPFGKSKRKKTSGRFFIIIIIIFFFLGGGGGGLKLLSTLYRSYHDREFLWAEETSTYS